jgi:cytochrome c biogenesis protein CcmG, thiol:disulfide interchange protein DsbE
MPTLTGGAAEFGVTADSEGPSPSPLDGSKQRARRPRAIFFVVGVVLAAALGVGLFTSVGTKQASSRPVAGSSAPGFSLPNLTGQGTVGTPANGGGQGRAAVLLFFASWCTPCQSEIPDLAATYRTIRAAGGAPARVAVIGVDGSDPTAAARTFVSQSGVNFPVGADRSYAVTEGRYAFTGLPEAVFINASGSIVQIDYGPITGAELTTWVNRLAGPDAATTWRAS